MNDFLVP